MRSISDFLNQNSLEKLYLKSSTTLFKYEKLLITRRFHYRKTTIRRNRYKNFERSFLMFSLNRR